MGSNSTQKELENALSVLKATVDKMKFDTEDDIAQLSDHVKVVEDDLERLQASLDGIVSKHKQTKVKYEDDYYEAMSLLGGKIRNLEDKFDLLSQAQSHCSHCTCCGSTRTSVETERMEEERSDRKEEHASQVDKLCARLERRG